MNKYILSIDQGTSSSRAILFDDQFEIFGIEQKETKTLHPHQGWVEQSAQDIWNNQLSVIKTLLSKNDVMPEQITAIGITNQRETTVVWDNDGNPLYPAIIWQDRRTVGICEKLNKTSLASYIPSTTGLVLNPYFSATKLMWLLDHIPEARTRAKNGDIHFGTIDSWLIWNLTGGKKHCTDYSNASRTLLFNIKDLCWDKRILGELDIPVEILPEVVSSSGMICHTAPEIFGKSIPIAGIAGDQQSALYGQRCLRAGEAKNTYGTGCFLLMNTGDKMVESQNGLLTTIGWVIDNKVTYALEGSVFMAGAVIKWLRDELQIIDKASETEKIALSLADNEGVYFVPAFTGLGAPYWDTGARGIICGLDSGAGRAHIIRAALEAMAFQTRDVLVCMQQDTGLKITELHVDGGAAANDFLMQFQADILNCNVFRPLQIESTALGAALLAGRALGINLSDKVISEGKLFTPEIEESKRTSLCQGWSKAVDKARK